MGGRVRPSHRADAPRPLRPRKRLSLLLSLLVTSAPAPIGGWLAESLPIEGAVQLDVAPGGVVCAATAEGDVVCAAHGEELLTVAEGIGAVEVALYAGGLCARTREGEVLCWRAEESEEGLPEYGPAEHQGGRRARALGAAPGFVCAAEEGGRLSCFGGELGRIPDENDAQEVALGSDSSGCLVRSTGQVACWGEPARWADVRQIRGITSMVVGTRHACGVQRGGGALCWGEVPGRSMRSGEIVTLHASAPIQALALTRQHTCTLTDEGAACNGVQLGVAGARAIAAADESLCVAATEQVWCWAPGRPSADAKRQQPSELVVAIGDRLYFGGGKRSLPNRAEERLFELGAAVDVTPGKPGDDMQEWLLGLSLDARTADFTTLLLAGGIVGGAGFGEGATVALSCGAGGLRRGGLWQPIGLATVRLGMRGVLDAKRLDELHYAFELTLYASAQVSLTKPRLVEVTGGLAVSPSVLAALAYAAASD